MAQKKVVLLGISSILLVAMVIAAVVSMGSGNEDYDENGMATSKKAIKDICQTTDYQKTCVSSLSSNAGNTTDPKELIRVSFQVAMKAVKEAVNNSNVIKTLGQDPRSKEALENCRELTDLAVNDLKRAFEKFDRFDLNTLDELVADIRIWLSGSVTYQETCVNGFEDNEEKEAEVMKKALNSSMELTSNALAMVMFAENVFDLKLTNKRIKGLF